MFTALREGVVCLKSEMGHDPETSLEREAASDDPDVFLLTHENIKALQLLVEQVLQSVDIIPTTIFSSLRRSSSLIHQSYIHYTLSLIHLNFLRVKSGEYLPLCDDVFS